MRVLKYGKVNDMPYGWISESDVNRAIYCMWQNMWYRIYNDIHYFGRTIQFDYKFLSHFAYDVSRLNNYDTFRDNPKGWTLDKDIKGGHLDGYYFPFLSLVSRADNSLECMNRIQPKSKDKVPIIGIHIKFDQIKLYKSMLDANKDGFHIKACIPECLKGNRKTHKGYKWYYINYKHNKRLRKISS